MRGEEGLGGATGDHHVEGAFLMHMFQAYLDGFHDAVPGRVTADAAFVGDDLLDADGEAAAAARGAAHNTLDEVVAAAADGHHEDSVSHGVNVLEEDVG